MKKILERVLPNQNDEEYLNHLERYKFAGQFIKDKIVLDVACGTGYGSYELLKKGAKKVIGIDISPEAIDYAKKHYQDSNLEFQIGNVENLSLPNESVDLVVSFETVEHLKDYHKFLNDLCRILKPGGRLIISTPNKMAVLRNIIYYFIFRKPRNKWHCIEFTKKQFCQLLGKYFCEIALFGQYEMPQKSFFYFIKKLFHFKDIQSDNNPKIIPYPKDINKTTGYFIALCIK